MEKLKLYVVTKPSSDSTLKKGDLVWLSENEDLNNAMVGGWLSKDEWDITGINDFEYELCKTHYLDVANGTESVRKIL